MTRFGWLMFVAILLVIGGVSAGAIYLHDKNAVATPDGSTATSTPLTNPSALSIYTNGEYGFSFFYPASARVIDSYSTSTETGILWRLGATQKGVPLVRIQNSDSEMRIGMSTTTKATSQCLKANPSEKSIADTKVASTTWKTFSFDKLGTDNPTHVVSYRTLHGDACFALETIEPLDSTASTTNIRSLSAENIVQSFSFSRP